MYSGEEYCVSNTALLEVLVGMPVLHSGEPAPEYRP